MSDVILSHLFSDVLAELLKYVPSSKLSVLVCLCVSTVSRYTNAFAITQLCGVLCAPWNGLIMDRHKGKPRAAGKASKEDFPPPFWKYFELLFKFTCKFVVKSAVKKNSLACFTITGRVCVCRWERAGSRPAGLRAVSLRDGAAVCVVLSVRHHCLPAAPVPHLHPAGDQPLLPLRRQRGLHQRGVSIEWTRFQSGFVLSGPWTRDKWM